MPQDTQTLVTLLGQGRLQEAEQMARKMTRRADGNGMVWKALAEALKLQGRTAESLEPMKLAAALLPNDPETANVLGSTCKELGRLNEAEESYRRAIKIRPDYAEPYYNLAVVLNELDRPQEAEPACRQAIKLKPGYAEAFSILGVALKKMGKFEEAIDALQRSLQLNPRYLEAHNNLGSCFNALGRYDEAKETFLNLLKIRPDFADAYNNLGATLYRQGKLHEAEVNYRQALKYRPDYAPAHFNLGIVLKDLGRLDDAIASYQQALQYNRLYIECYNNLAIALNDAGRCSEAEAVLRKAIQLFPHDAQLHCNLGLTLKNLNQPAKAEAALRQALRIHPNHVDALTTLGVVVTDLGRGDEAVAALRRALQIHPDNLKIHDSLLLCSQYLSGSDPAVRLNDAKAYGAAATRKARTAFSSWLAGPSPAKLRVGLVSADFHNDAVGYFPEGLLAHLDRSKIELVAYSGNVIDDELTARIRPFFSSWKSLIGKDDVAAAELIYRDGVHLLLDLSGHSAGNRLPVFAYRPAPVQAAWLGYPGTTGLSEMDYLLGDPCVTPEGEESQYTEKIWRLPESYLCLTPPEFNLEVNPPPCRSSGSVTFGSFNNLTKMNDGVVAVWARVLDRVSGSTLFLMTKLLNDPTVCEAVRRRFADHGIGSDRLILEGTSSREQMLRGYHRIDIALDPFPYPGTTTTAEAVWMGVPVLTRRGNSFLSHVGESILSNVGLSGWIAGDDDDYVAKAAWFAANADALAALRSRLRQQALASPLFDVPRFARNFEAALWGMWREKTGTPR